MPMAIKDLTKCAPEYVQLIQFSLRTRMPSLDNPVEGIFSS